LNEGLYVFENFVLGVLLKLLYYVFLSDGVSSEEVRDRAEEDGVGKLNVINDVLF
jgi:hypothetical protein